MNREQLKQKFARNKNLIGRWAYRLLMVGVVLFILKYVLWIFVWDRYPVPTDSMYPTIEPNDRIMVNKLIFGARIYKSTDFLKDSSEPSVFRMPGWRAIQRDDILVFNFPNIDKRGITFRINQAYVKRCVGLPGDTLSVVDGYYRVAGVADDVGYMPAQHMMARTPDSLVRANPHNIYPWNMPHWNLRNFGPIYIPRSGRTVALDSLNYSLYCHIMRRESGKSVKRDSLGVFRIGNDVVTSYKFRDNYYFMNGDNGNTSDSRYFGFVPEDYIVGVATIIWDSHTLSGKKRWERVLKMLE